MIICRNVGHDRSDSPDTKASDLKRAMSFPADALQDPHRILSTNLSHYLFVFCIPAFRSQTVNVGVHIHILIRCFEFKSMCIYWRHHKNIHIDVGGNFWMLRSLKS